jgi:hypothetical protein
VPGVVAPEKSCVRKLVFYYVDLRVVSPGVYPYANDPELPIGQGHDPAVLAHFEPAE